ncbi:septum site-determining protein MinC [Baaleninema simplex]|uniref:septum site-determining protein MinC n=1 Tax=Baaleninema simplex TaxID=2862350 RepID=UPI0003449B07|nr:septum site-determining protein MinC [Baaleninema simplex]
MVSDSPTPTDRDVSSELTDTAESTQSEGLNLHQQIRLKSDGGQLVVHLPPQSDSDTAGELTWQELWQQLKHRLQASDRSWQPNTRVRVVAGDRLLDSRQLQELDDALSQAQLKLERVFTRRRQTAVAAATAGYSVEQPLAQDLLQQTSELSATALAEPLYLHTTLRSGTEIRHPGNVVLVGDVNPGGAVIAEGDILIWGRLRGVAHAGAAGNPQSLIMALQMEPTQIRIADSVARAPSDKPSQYYPEVAYITPHGIRISRAADFVRPTAAVSPDN